ncbi:MAG: methyl-accepting chemotaxis protein [Vicinamibacterales bacterium]
MSSWSLGRKLYLGIGALVALILLTSGAALWSEGRIKNDLDVATKQTAKKLELSLRVRQNALVMRSEQRRVLLAAFGNDPALLAESRKSIDEVLERNRTRIDEIAPLLVTEAGRKMLADITTAVDAWAASNDKVEALVVAGRLQDAWKLAVDESNPLVNKVDELADGLIQQQTDFLAESIVTSDASYRATWIMSGVVLVVGLAIGLVVVWLVVGIVKTLRGTAVELTQGAEQVASASGQVSTGAQSLSQGTTEQAASLEETSASMEEMASMTRQNAQNANHAAALVGESAQEFASCDTALREMVTSMSQISESSQKIARIIKTIDEIAFQTNILALNAAVEAARAGEAGMGFAVVADEVRNLAQRSAQAAKDTASLIDEAVTSAADGDTRLKALAGSIERIGSKSGEVKALVEEISTASAQQTQGIDQVAQAIQQMEKVTQTTAATAEESAAASEELSAQAQLTMTAAAGLARLVDGGAGPVAAAAVAKPAARRPGRGKVVPMHRATADAPEAVIPLEGDGTFGTF